MPRFGISVVVALLLVPAAVSSADLYQQPRIHVSTRLVEISVIVRDKNGTVENLTKNDFTVLDRGKPQQINIFLRNSTPTTQQSVELLPQNTFSDLPQYGGPAPRSVTIVLLDNLNTLYGSAPENQYENTPFWVEDLALQNARKHLIRFIKTLGPSDRVAIYSLRDSLHVLCDFTSDRDQLLGILQNYNAAPMTDRALSEPSDMHPPIRASWQQEARGFENKAGAFRAGVVNGDRAAETMAALQQIAAHVANIPGRKNLVWLTANLPFSGAAMARILEPADIAVYPVDARGLQAQGFTEQAMISGSPDADEDSGAPGRDNTMPAESSHPIGIDAMEKLADETGGQAFVNTNDITGAIRKAVEDSAVTYTLGFYIDRSALDGKFHEIKVEVKGKSLTVHYPKGYFAYPDTAPTKDEDQTRLLSAVQSPLESSVIPLQASLSRVNQPRPDSLNLSCAIDIRDLQLVQSGNLRKGSVIVYVIEQDEAGKVVYQWDKGYKFQMTDAQYATLLKSGMMFHQNLHPKAGVTTLRVVVQDPSTNDLGSLIIPLSQVN